MAQQITPTSGTNMAKPWAEVANSEGYKSLAPDQQEAARNQYFDQVVAPRAPQDKLSEVRAQFDTATKSQAAPQPSIEQEIAAGRAQALTEGTLSPDGSRVVRPDGTTIPYNVDVAPAENTQEPAKNLRLPEKREPRIPIPTNWQVAKNAAAKGAAGVADMVGNAGVNTVNLLTAAGGAGLYEAGLIDAPPELPLEAPNMAEKVGLASNVINQEYDPQNTEQRLIDAGVQGLVGGALTGGSGGVKTVLANTLSGGASSLGSQSAAEAGLSPALQLGAGLLAGGSTAAGVNRMTGATTNINAMAKNKIVDEGFAKAKNAGFVIPSSQSNPNSMIANTLDVVAGGRPRMQQAASIKNQATVNEMAAKALGLDKDTQITPDVLKAIRGDAVSSGYEPIKAAGVITTRPEYNAALDKLTEQSRKAKAGFQGYDDSGIVKAVEQLRTKQFDADSGISMIQQLRDDASGAYTRGDKTLGKALKGAAGAIEDEIEAHLAASGDKTALKTFKDARTAIAKTYSVEKSLNEATGNVSATKLARQLDKGAPLSGELRDIAMAAKLPGASLADTKYATTGASQLEMLAALGAGGAGIYGSGGDTSYAGLAAIPLARAGFRRMALTRPITNTIGAPNYKKFGITPQNRNAMIVNSGLNAERQSDK